MNIPKLLPIAACALAFLAAGCTTSTQFVKIPDLNAKVQDPSKGRIYVVRPTNFGWAASFEVWDGNTHVGNTGGKSFLCWEREPGEAIISGREENVSTVSVWVKTNEVYYVTQYPKMGWIQARNELKVVSKDDGVKELKKCRAPKVSKCKDHAECRGEPPKKK